MSRLRPPILAGHRPSAVRAITGLCILVGIGWLGAAIAVHAAGSQEMHQQTYDAIIVAGCSPAPDGTPSDCLARRTLHAVELWRQGIAPHLVLTGGHNNTSAREARVAAELAAGVGVSPDAIVVEDRSTSTEENARFSAELIGPARVLVVTDRYHVWRCRQVYRRYFVDADAVATDGPIHMQLWGTFREVLAIAWYALRGRL